VSKLEMADYLKSVQNVKERLLLTRFRVGVLALRIETGVRRWESGGVQRKRGIPVEFRVCQCFNAGKVEDEIHFLLECGKYVLERESLLNVIKLEVFAKRIRCTDFWSEVKSRGPTSHQ
jgi:hypothetical protein